ncbi:hypothetical protein C485_15260 [Natrinema altunense JCM 12890]|uniref:Uncharacterized protein n=1 Tax=Natrinema altunense (strain JCM 12890 / CGMCC 1.3731 / AJ2) TaxID=1227494 RepID=L9ZHT8_NATA2|nr:hypothetical protein C485_15260 [Natrinema altunense JCM 12890]
MPRAGVHDRIADDFLSGTRPRPAFRRFDLEHGATRSDVSAVRRAQLRRPRSVLETTSSPD